MQYIFQKTPSNVSKCINTQFIPKIKFIFINPILDCNRFLIYCDKHSETRPPCSNSNSVAIDQRFGDKNITDDFYLALTLLQY